MRLFRYLLENPFELIVPLALLIGIIFAGLIVRRILTNGLRNWAKRTQTYLGTLVADTIHGPALLWIVILAVHVAAGNSDIPLKYQRIILKALEVLWVWSLISAASRLAGRSVRFYGGRVTGAQSVTSLTEKLVQLVIVIIGLAWILRVIFSLNLTPILTTLGVGGIAVALALQDTLSNLFAGFYVSISGLVRMGDYIKLSTGEEGFVSDINWRCTTFRNGAGNLVVVPNNKLSQTTFTNFYLPDGQIGTSIPVSVGLDADIDRVEAMLLEESKAAVGAIPGLLGDPAPSVAFSPGPTRSALIFQVNFKVANLTAQAGVQNELKKRIFKRMRQDGVPFPSFGLPRT